MIESAAEGRSRARHVGRFSGALAGWTSIRASAMVAEFSGDLTETAANDAADEAVATSLPPEIVTRLFWPMRAVSISTIQESDALK